MRIIELLSPKNLPLTEGGNIFKGPDGQITTVSINKADIDPTLAWLEKITGLPLLDNKLGSVGKKAISGDLDVSVDETKISKDELVAKLSSWVVSQKGVPKDWIRKVGTSVSFKTPIKGDPTNGFVQTDLMFHKDPKWMKFSMYSPGDSSKFSGAVRNMIMSSIAKSQGLKYSWQNGLVRREDETPISSDPNVIAKKLLGPKQTSAVFNSVETIQAALSQNPTLIKKLQDLKEALLATELNGVPKKPGQIKVDQEEANRISAVLRDIT